MEPLTSVRFGVRRRLGGRRALRSEQGAAAVEFALVASLLFMLVFGIIDFGWGFHAWNNISNAAREGARLGAVSPDVGDITQRVREAAGTLDPARLDIAVQCSRDRTSFGSCTSWEEGDLVRVTVHYHYDLITPLGAFVPGLRSGLDLQAISEARFEG